jgi:outer membrane protein assembly factor BamB
MRGAPLRGEARPAGGRASALLLALLALSGCGLWPDDEEVLEGTRIPVRTEEADRAATAAVPLALPPPVSLADWTHRAANPQRLAPHVVLASGLDLVWSADAGAGNAGRALVTAAPVIAEGRIYTLDAAARVSAFSAAGALLWQVSAGREGEPGTDGWGGGLAYADGRLIVTTGFGETLALDPATGGLLWRTGVDAPVRAAPAVLGSRVVVVTRDDQAFGLDAATGEIAWRVQGSTGVTGLIGGASPAMDDVLAILPFASGEVAAVIALTGRRVWTAAIAGGRRGLARTAIGDITSDPVIDGETIYVANQSGRIVAIDRRTGRRNWTANDGSYNPVAVAGGSLFLMSDKAELLRLDALSGTRIWAVQLPEYEDEEDRQNAIGYGGPVLAGGRLIVVTTRGEIIAFDPENGAELGRTALPGGSYLPPAVAGGRLYVMTTGGDLVAFQ